MCGRTFNLVKTECGDLIKERTRGRGSACGNGNAEAPHGLGHQRPHDDTRQLGQAVAGQDAHPEPGSHDLERRRNFARVEGQVERDPSSPRNRHENVRAAAGTTNKGFFGQLGIADAVVGCQPAVGWHHSDHVLFTEYCSVEALDGQTDDTGLGGPLVEPIPYLFLASFEQPDGDSRVPLGEGSQLRSDERGGCCRQARQAQRPSDVTNQASYFGAHQRQLAHRFAGVRQRNGTGLSQREPVAATNQQRQSQFLFKRGVVNNVAVARFARIGSINLDDLFVTYDLNVRAAVQVVQAVLPGMLATGWGRIVNVTSLTTLGTAERTPYAATKAALEACTRIWAGELAQSGITVNAVAPGPIETEMYRERGPIGSDREAQVLQTIPLRRVGTPREIAHAICALLDEDAGYITGQIIRADGGGSIAA
jgi:3-oxoacyl-[acyl-carrier protein] reductase